MTKKEFIVKLRKALRGMPKEEREERLTFYEEMIDDRVEEGLTEEDAVAAVGTVDKVASQIMAEAATVKKPKEKKKRTGWSIALLILGSPVWFVLLIAGFAVVFSIYVCFWAVAISLWAVFAACIVAVPCGMIVSIILICQGSAAMGFAMVGATCVFASLAILLFFACKALSKGVCVMTIKVLFPYKRKAKKEEVAS